MWRKRKKTHDLSNAIRRTTVAFERFSMVMALNEMETACEREFSNRVADWIREDAST